MGWYQRRVHGRSSGESEVPFCARGSGRFSSDLVVGATFREGPVGVSAPSIFLFFSNERALQAAQERGDTLQPDAAPAGPVQHNTHEYSILLRRGPDRVQWLSCQVYPREFPRARTAPGFL